MGRFYTLPMENIAISAVQNLFSAQVPADVILKLWGFTMFQTSDVGDSEEEILRVLIERQTGTFTVGSGGAAVTPVRANEGDAASVLTVRRNDTTIATGTFEVGPILGFNNRIGIEKIWAPEPGMTFFGTSDLVIHLPGAPADALSVSCYADVEEIG